MYSNNIVNFQESTTILNACTKKSGNLLNALRIMYILSIIAMIQIKNLTFYHFYICHFNKMIVLGWVKADKSKDTIV